MLLYCIACKQQSSILPKLTHCPSAPQLCALNALSFAWSLRLLLSGLDLQA